MCEHVDAFCPACGANIGPGTYETIGCPLCGDSDDLDDESDFDESGDE